MQLRILRKRFSNLAVSEYSQTFCAIHVFQTSTLFFQTSTSKSQTEIYRENEKRGFQHQPLSIFPQQNDLKKERWASDEVTSPSLYSLDYSAAEEASEMH